MHGELQNQKRISLVVVDDYRIFDDALGLAFADQCNIDVFGMVNNCYAAYPVLLRARIDVALIGADIPLNDTLWLAREGQLRFPQSKLLVMLGGAQMAAVEALIEVGVTGFVLKTQPLTELLDAIRFTARGQAPMPSKLPPRAPQRAHQDFAQKIVPSNLHITRRELEILAQLSQGMGVDNIAIACNITPMTVRTHIRNLMDKLNVHTRLEAVSYALSRGLIVPPHVGTTLPGHTINT